MIAFLLFGIGILAFSLSGIQKGIDSENWPTAQGTIISSEVESYYDSDDHDYSYQPRVRYSYTVKGIDYFSEDIFFNHFT